jgi:RimJ/RimL family protein N-acetyltransferase
MLHQFKTKSFATNPGQPTALLLLKTLMIAMKTIDYIKTFFKVYSNIVLTYVSNDIKDIDSPAKISVVDYLNYKDALVYEPQNKVEQFKKFLDSGDRGYYAYIDRKWAHRSWVTFGPKMVYRWHNFAPLMLQEDEAYIHWCETVPFARGKNVYPKILSEILKDLLKNYKKIYISTTIDNIASQKGILKAGFSEIEAVKVFSFMHITLHKTVHTLDNRGEK